MTPQKFRRPVRVSFLGLKYSNYFCSLISLVFPQAVKHIQMKGKPTNDFATVE